MKIFIQFILSLLGAILLGIFGLGFGAQSSDSFGFPAFGGNAAGYESGGVFFAIVGISLGSLLGIAIAKKAQKEKCKYLINAIIACVTIFISLIIFDRNIPLEALLGILIMPALLMTAAANLKC